jgi:hypothetical protein
MTVKLHLFKGFELPQRVVRADSELGHLYSDTGDREELFKAADDLGLERRWIQQDRFGFEHFDLWRRPLQRAKVMFTLVDDQEFILDCENLKKGANNG